MLIGLSARWTTQHRGVLGKALQEAGELIAGEVPRTVTVDSRRLHRRRTKFLVATRGAPKLHQIRPGTGAEAPGGTDRALRPASRRAAARDRPASAKLGDDAEAQQMFAKIRDEAKALGVPIRELYAVTSRRRRHDSRFRGDVRRGPRDSRRDAAQQRCGGR